MYGWLITFFLPFLFPVYASAQTIMVSSQQSFDCLDERIDSILAAGEREVDVRFGPGTYFFREGHLDLSGIQNRNAVLRLRGDSAVLVGADDGETYRFEKGYVDLSAQRHVDIRRPVRRAKGWPVKCLFRRGVYKIRCDEEDLSCEQAEGVKIILSQWYVGAVYPVVSVRNGFLYFRKEPEYHSWMWSEFRFGRCLPRYILCTPPQRKDLHACSASGFLSMDSCRMASVLMEGLTFLGNGEGRPLLSIRDVRADSISIRNCRFEGIRSQVVSVEKTDHFYLKDNRFYQCYLGAVFFAQDTEDVIISDNQFVDNGLRMTSIPIVDCKGRAFRVSRNYIENYAHSAIGVGIHFMDTVGQVTSGVVERNEICMSEHFRNQVPRELIDGGAIYIWTQNKDVSIRNNFIHDLDGPHGNRGIFADDGAVGVEIAGNLLLSVHGGRCIDLRKALRVERKRVSCIRRVNVRNRMDGNVLDGRSRFYTRKGDPASYVGRNLELKPGYDRSEVIRQWKARLP